MSVPTLDRLDAVGPRRALKGLQKPAIGVTSSINLAIIESPYVRLASKLVLHQSVHTIGKRRKEALLLAQVIE